MAELFDSYAADVEQLHRSIASHIASARNASPESRQKALREAQENVSEANELLGQMDIEVQGFPQSVRGRYATQLRELRTQIEGDHRDIRSLYSSGTPDGDTDVATPTGDAYAQRQRLLQGSATLEDGSRRLQESHRIALETEDIGAGILRDLQGQREQIEHSRDTQQVVRIAIVVVLVLLILIILYAKIF
ncbi:t-SNARE VTI1 [Malassezia cuniculi]|uniref:t-SNARE VTI1 n=1 Tax=Malassezia cuniculi TaxID=948313 RepID=A0AAF0EWA2_9BASI|nr:t-SNARE VTI1 [Malassezia cuniculi]